MCAYLSTIARVSHPPSICSSCVGVPACRCHVAKVWRKSCHRKSVIPARSKAAHHAFVETLVIGLPKYVKTNSVCCPSRFCTTESATSFSGKPCERPFLKFYPETLTWRVSRSTSDQRKPVTFPCLMPVMTENNAMSARCGDLPPNPVPI
jgi:hypothetical protein